MQQQFPGRLVPPCHKNAYFTYHTIIGLQRISQQSREENAKASRNGHGLERREWRSVRESLRKLAPIIAKTGQEWKLSFRLFGGDTGKSSVEKFLVFFGATEIQLSGAA